ncbi:MAG: YaiI/YqxD family protein [Hyphomonadaceae bacterium]|nr:YaiI/YqxD family protein [Hyphomonadaceae bacterium]
MPVEGPAPILFVDADACPVKEEIYRVARRLGCPVKVVANSYLRTPPGAAMIVVDAGPDAADDWIADNARPRDIVITSDIPLAARALKAGAAVLAPNGKAFTEASIGAALAQRSLMEHLRSFGEITGGPKAFSPQDRSRFLSALDAAVHKARRP